MIKHFKSISKAKFYQFIDEISISVFPKKGIHLERILFLKSKNINPILNFIVQLLRYITYYQQAEGN